MQRCLWSTPLSQLQSWMQGAALLIGEPVTVATHDQTMKTVAEHLGLTTADPFESPAR